MLYLESRVLRQGEGQEGTQAGEPQRGEGELLDLRLQGLLGEGCKF